MLAAGMLTRLLAGPMLGMLADRAGSLRFALAICTALAAASAAALLWAQSFALLLFITVIQAASLAPTTSLADALSVNAARPRLAGKEFEYGWIRGSASLAFIFGTLTVGQFISRTRCYAYHLDEFDVSRRSSRLNCIVTTCRAPLFDHSPADFL